MNNLSFTPVAWDEYLSWQTQDKKTAQKINQLFKDILRNRFTGIGKPEPLKHRPDCWSRRIDEKNRLVYCITGENDVLILSCKGHYDDK